MDRGGAESVSDPVRVVARLESEDGKVDVVVLHDLRTGEMGLSVKRGGKVTVRSMKGVDFKTFCAAGLIYLFSNLGFTLYGEG